MGILKSVAGLIDAIAGNIREQTNQMGLDTYARGVEDGRHDVESADYVMVEYDEDDE